MTDLTAAEPLCGVPAPAPCDTLQPSPADAKLCGHTAEQYAEAALMLEPRGDVWCRLLGTIKAALYRAFGKLLADLDARICDLVRESTGCEAVELLGEFEEMYGLPSACMTNYPTDLAGRQAMVCAARQSIGISTLDQLQALLQTALNCPHLRLENFVTHSTAGGWTGGMGQPLMVQGGICVRGIGPAPVPPILHNVMGGWGGYGGAAVPYGSAVGQPLTIVDPAYVAPQSCPVVYHSTMGGWTGGMGQPLTAADPVAWNLLSCLMAKHLPATTAWAVCK
jgi:hypothetical protein